jgi:hypothetical protein
MRLFAVYFFLIYFTIGCNDRVNIKMKVKNDLQYNVESMVLKTSGGSELIYGNLPPNELVELRLDLADIPKTDGHYIIEYDIKDSSIVRHFGYYTNGYPINSGFDIGIQVDTILIKEF